MIAMLRYNLKIVAPTLLWTGILVSILSGLILMQDFRKTNFTSEDASWLAEWLIPLIAAFFSAGVLDVEMKRGAHELLQAKRRPLWHTVAWRLLVSVGISLLLGIGFLTLLHFGAKRLPLGLLILASIPSTLILALISLWTRIRLGNAFVGYLAAIAIWVVNWVIGILSAFLGINPNPLLTMSSFSDRLHAIARGALETTPYVDWWWVNKLALIAAAMLIFISVTRRVEQLVEAD